MPFAKLLLSNEHWYGEVVSFCRLVGVPAAFLSENWTPAIVPSVSVALAAQLTVLLTVPAAGAVMLTLGSALGGGVVVVPSITTGCSMVLFWPAVLVTTAFSRWVPGV